MTSEKKNNNKNNNSKHNKNVDYSMKQYSFWKDVSDQIRAEIKEFYTVNTFFILANSFLIALFNSSDFIKENPIAVAIFIGILNLCWFFEIILVHRWVHYWQSLAKYHYFHEENEENKPFLWKYEFGINVSSPIITVKKIFYILPAVFTWFYFFLLFRNFNYWISAINLFLAILFLGSSLIKMVFNDIKNDGKRLIKKEAEEIIEYIDKRAIEGKKYNKFWFSGEELKRDKKKKKKKKKKKIEIERNRIKKFFKKLNSLNQLNNLRSKLFLLYSYFLFLASLCFYLAGNGIITKIIIPTYIITLFYEIYSMENNKAYIGNFKKDANKNRGWFIGHFIKKGIRKTDKFEVKYWSFEKGKTDHKQKIQKEVLECTLILKGRIRGTINGQKVELQAGEYAVIPPGIKNNFPQYVEEKVEGITIKSPSQPEDKKEIE